MVEKIIKNLRLSNMDGHALRETKCLFYMDENSGPNSIEEYKLKKERKKNPVNLGKNFYDLPFISKVKEEDYQRFNNLKENRLPRPYRDYENYTNPISHFRTPGYDKQRNSYTETVKTEPITEPTPNNTKPEDINSKRLNCPNVFEELNRNSENDPNTLLYNSRQQSLDACRAHLRAKERMNIVHSLEVEERSKPTTFISNAFPEFTPKRNENALESEIRALKYMYTSTSQKAAEDIPFDSYLHPRRWAPISTIEKSADPMRASYLQSKTYPCVNNWKGDVNLNKYEMEQRRPDFFLEKRPHDFCAPMKKAHQIPTYSGCVGALNKDDMENPYKPDFEPLSVLRSEVPKFTDCVERPVFVGYNGKIPYLPGNMKPPFHTDPTPRNVLGQPC